MLLAVPLWSLPAFGRRRQGCVINLADINNRESFELLSNIDETSSPIERG